MKFFRDRWVSAAKYRELVESVGQLELDFASSKEEFADTLAENARLRLENDELKATQDALAAQVAQDAVVIMQLRLDLAEARGGPR